MTSLTKKKSPCLVWLSLFPFLTGHVSIIGPEQGTVSWMTSMSFFMASKSALGSSEPRKKHPTFHYTGCMIGILILVSIGLLESQ